MCRTICMLSDAELVAEIDSIGALLDLADRLGESEFISPLTECKLEALMREFGRRANAAFDTLDALSGINVAQALLNGGVKI